MTTNPISISVTEGDTHPVCIWTMLDSDGNAEDVTSASKTATLYYFNGYGGPDLVPFWKVVLTKSATPTDGTMKFTASSTEPYYPAALISVGGGPRQLRGWLRYIDSGATPPIDVWIEDALRVYANQKLAEPA